MTCYGYGTKPRIIARDNGLMKEQTVSQFKALSSSIESVYLVEASPALRDKQKQLLCEDRPIEEIEIGFRSKSKYSGIPVTWCDDIRFVPNGIHTSPI